MRKGPRHQAGNPQNEDYLNMGMSYIVGCVFWCSFQIMKFSCSFFIFWPSGVTQMGRGPGHQLGRGPQKWKLSKYDHVIHRWMWILMLISYYEILLPYFHFLAFGSGPNGQGPWAPVGPTTLKMKVIQIWPCHTSLDVDFDAHIILWNFVALFSFLAFRSGPNGEWP